MQMNDQSPVGTPNPGAETPSTTAQDSLTRRAFVNRLKMAAVVAPLAVAAIATLPKAQAY